MPISVVFDPPLPSDSPATFNTKAFALLGDLNDWSTQANALPGEVATNLSALLASGSVTAVSVSGAIYATGGGKTGRIIASGGSVYMGSTDAPTVIQANNLPAISIDAAGIASVPYGIAIESVISPTLLNGWVNYGAGYSSCGYRKDAFGFVHLQGMIKDGTITTNAFVLPVGYRPVETLRFVVVTNSLFGWATIKTDGSVEMTNGANNYFSIDGLTFKAA